MIDSALYLSGRSILSDSAHRCCRCGQGPVMAGDGFMMSHCMNCGNWQPSTEPLGISIGVLKEKLAAWFGRTKAAFLGGGK